MPLIIIITAEQEAGRERLIALSLFTPDIH